MRSPRVLLVNNKGLDMTSAKAYGELITLYPEQPNDVFACSKHTFIIKNKLKDAVKLRPLSMHPH
jgi:hypothetical protein